MPNLSESNEASLDTLFDELADRLSTRGWHVLPDFLDISLVDTLRDDLHEYQYSGALTPAGIGRGADFKLDTSVRTDKTRWLARNTDAQIRYLDLMETMRQAMNHRLFFGLFDYESHFAFYEPGAYYRKHKDSFRGAAGRLLTTVAYLNKDWREDDGGLLVLFDPISDRETARILPSAGTLAVFLSEEIAHEVEPTRRWRASIAGWFRCHTGMAR